MYNFYNETGFYVGTLTQMVGAGALLCMQLQCAAISLWCWRGTRITRSMITSSAGKQSFR